MYETIIDLINNGKLEGKRSVHLSYILPEDVKKRLQDAGYRVIGYNGYTRVRWPDPRAGSSGKISMPDILDFIAKLAPKHNKNIFTL